MKEIVLGSTGIKSPQNAFGALPIQRDDFDTAVKILVRAYEGGMTFFDTARLYSDSEEKLGLALTGNPQIRKNIYVASKTMAKTPEEIRQQIKTTLTNLKTDYLDLYQFHCADKVYAPGDGTGMYEVMLELKEQGLIRHIGITAHKIGIAEEAVKSGLYETLQFPFSYLSSQREIELVALCKERNVGFIAMKALAGGLINNSKAAFAFISKFDNVLPIWGIQKMTELEEWLSYFEQPAQYTQEIDSFIKEEQAALNGEFCRGCGYCMPCPQGIVINNCARMSLMLRRAPSQAWLNDYWRKAMADIEKCTGCGKCKTKCPYELDTPELLKKNLADYKDVLAGKVKVE